MQAEKKGRKEVRGERGKGFRHRIGINLLLTDHTATRVFTSRSARVGASNNNGPRCSSVDLSVFRFLRLLKTF